MFADADAYNTWSARWRSRLAAESGPAAERADAMRLANPAYIPRNHLVAEVIAAAVERGDFAPFEALLAVGKRPFEEEAGLERYAAPARPDQCVWETFCGT